MKTQIILSLVMSCFSTLLLASSSNSSQLNEPLLSNPRIIYTNGKTIQAYPSTGFTKKSVPINNDYTGQPGCYVTCYSSSPKHAVLEIRSNVYLMGQIRVPGKYHSPLCVPKHYKTKDISTEDRFKRLCKKKIQGCKTHCWATGNSIGTATKK